MIKMWNNLVDQQFTKKKTVHQLIISLPPMFSGRTNDKNQFGTRSQPELNLHFIRCYCWEVAVNRHFELVHLTNKSRLLYDKSFELQSRDYHITTVINKQARTYPRIGAEIDSTKSIQKKKKLKKYRKKNNFKRRERCCGLKERMDNPFVYHFCLWFRLILNNIDQRRKKSRSIYIE